MSMQASPQGAPSGPAAAIFGVFALAAVVFGLLIYHAPASEFGIHEVRVLETAREMLAEGDWIVPRFAGEPRLAKPPLPYWLAMASFAAAGEAGIPAGRRVLPVLAVVMLLSAYAMARRLMPPFPSALAMAVLAGSHIFLIEFRKLTPDPVFAAMIAASVACLAWAGPGSDGRRRRGLLLSGYGFLALALLAKGPLAIPFVAAGVLALKRKGERPAASLGVHLALGALAFLPLAAWALAIHFRVDAALDVWRSEMLGRLPGGRPADGGRGIEVYLGALPLFLLPATLPLLLALLPGSGVDGRLRWGFLAGFAFLLVLSSRKLAYMLPLAPLAAVLAAQFLTVHGSGALRFRGGVFPVAASAQMLLLLAVPLLAVGYGARSYLDLSGESIPAAALMVATLGAGAFCIWTGRSPLGPAVATALLGMVLVVSVLRPLRPVDLADYNLAMRVRAAGARELFQAGARDGRLCFYMRRVPAPLESLDGLPASAASGSLVLVPESMLPERVPERLELIGRQSAGPGDDPLLLFHIR